ncbi:MAG: D-alanyl-D-alanine carboxypeptidase family protein [Acidimicrobiia bacterium]
MSRRTLAVICLAALQIAAISPPRPIERLPVAPPPTVSALAWILYDETNDVVLGGVDIDVPRPMASTTKMMTGLLAIESGRMDEIVTVSARASDIGEAEIGLEPGERLPMSMLVNALLIRSGNDAAIAVGEHLAGSVEQFVATMNARAAELGMTSTSFANPHGLDAEGHFSSPRDLLTLGRTAMANPGFAEIAGTTRFRVADAPDGTERIAEATNTLLTTYRGTFGVKTGFTFRAGLVFVGGAERDGRRVWVVVMGSDGSGAHFRDAVALLDHGFEELRIVDTIARGTPFRLEPDRIDPEVTALARLHALTLIGSLDDPPVAIEVPEPVEPPTELITAELPGPAEALRWLFSGVGNG